LFTDDVVWHQPGVNRFSGVHHGSAAVGELVGGVMTVSEGTFSLWRNGSAMLNGSVVGVDARARRLPRCGCSAPIRSRRTRSGVSCRNGLRPWREIHHMAAPRQYLGLLESRFGSPPIPRTRGRGEGRRAAHEVMTRQTSRNRIPAHLPQGLTEFTDAGGEPPVSP
jgi:hypothetical protein